MENQIFALIASFFVAYLIIPLEIKFNQTRINYDGDLIELGGLAIVGAIVISAITWGDIDWLSKHHEKKVLELELNLFAIFFYFVLSSIFGSTIRSRSYGNIFVSTLAASFLVYFTNVSIYTLYGFFNISTIPSGLNLILTSFLVYVIGRSILYLNVMMEGLGLCVSGIAFIGFGSWYYWLWDTTYSTLAFSALGAVITYLFFTFPLTNFKVNYVTLNIIGFILAILTIHFIDVNYLHSHKENMFDFKAIAVTVIITVAISVSTVLRLQKNKIHLLQNGTNNDSNNQKKLLLMYTLMQVVLIVLSIALRDLMDNELIALITSFIISYLLIKKSIKLRLVKLNSKFLF